MNNPIEIRDVVKKFGPTVALDGLDLTVRPGQVHGFLGPNGAGKSTTLRVLLGLLRVDAGQVRLLGGDPWADAATLHEHLAYVPGDVNLWPNLTGGEAIDLLCRSRRRVDPAARAELIDRFDLDPRKKGRTYSKGNRQKVALIAALASRVDLLLLDEPTSGLDPLMERVFTEVIRERTAAGATVLLSSHILSEVERLCDHVSIIRAGRVVDTGTLAELRHLHRTQVTAEVAPDPALDALPGLHDVTRVAGRWSAQVDRAAVPALLEQLGRLGTTAVTITPPSLEELFLNHYDTTAPNR